MKLVKLTGVAVLVATAFAVSAPSASAHSYDSEEGSHPFRLLSYPFHALGRGVEYGFGRPVHNYVSKPCNRYIWGHVSHPATENYGGDYNQYQRQSY